LCGIHHLCDVLVFTWPAYRFFTLIGIVGGFVSWITAMVTPFAVSYLLRFGTPDEIREKEEKLALSRERNRHFLAYIRSIKNGNRTADNRSD
jgi:hypothetical protein